MTPMEVLRAGEELFAPHTVEGWIHVLDVGVSNDLSLGVSFSQSWALRYCVLSTMGHTFSYFSHEQEAHENVLKMPEQSAVIIGSKVDPITADVKVPSEKPVGRRASRKERKVEHPDDCGYEKSLLKDRRGSVPTVVQTSYDDSSDTLSSSNRFMSFINRTSSQIKHNFNLKRAKSATKLETKKSDGVIMNGDTNASSPHNTLTNSLRRTMSLSRLSRRWQGRSRSSQERADSTREGGEQNSGSRAPAANNIRSSHSYESLIALPPSSSTSVDLSLPQVQIKPLHSSVFGQENCFQISTTNSTKLFSCRSATERQKWMQQ